MCNKTMLAQGQASRRLLMESRTATYGVCLGCRPKEKVSTHDARSISGGPLSLLTNASCCFLAIPCSVKKVHARSSRVGTKPHRRLGLGCPICTGPDHCPAKHHGLEGQRDFTRDMAQVLRKLVLVQRYNLRWAVRSLLSRLNFSSGLARPAGLRPCKSCNAHIRPLRQIVISGMGTSST